MIYEINPYFHVNLKKIVAIKQFMDEAPKRWWHRNEPTTYVYWIELTTDYGRHININCTDMMEMAEKYALFINAWEAYNEKSQYICDCHK